jgi:outer membrane receptor protein involved in Fe transport
VRLDHWRLGESRLLETDLATGQPTLAETRGARQGLEPTVRAGLVWRPVPALALRAAAYRGWRLPTLNELTRPFRAGQDATAANPDLAPERLFGIEAAIGWQPVQRVDLRLTAFANRLDGAIANVTVAQGPGVFPGVGFVPAGGQVRQRQNLEAIASHGVEGDLSLRFGRTAMVASLAAVDARVHGGGIDGKRPAQAPVFSASASLVHRARDFDARATLRHQGLQYEDDRNSRRLEPVTTIDFGASVPLSRRLSVGLDIENLTDAHVPTGYSGAAVELGQPRTIWFGVRLGGS